MRFTSVDHGLQLRVGEQAVAQDGGGQLRAVGGFWGRDRGHGRGLHQLGRVWNRAGDGDRLQAEGLVDRIREARGTIVLAHLAQGVGEVFGFDLSDGLRGLGRRSRARYADGLARRWGRVSREEGRTALTCRCGLIQLESAAELRR